MTKLFLIVFALFFYLASYTYASPPSNSTISDLQLKQILNREWNKFKIIAKEYDFTITNLLFSTTGPITVASNSTDIQVNIISIGNYLRNCDSNIVLFFSKFVLAHEIAHVIQSKKFDLSTKTHLNGGFTRFLECNADLIAGFLISQSINVIDLGSKEQRARRSDYSTYRRSLVENINKLYDKILHLENRGEFTKTHETNEERAIAVRQGFLMGNFEFDPFYSTPTNHDLDTSQDEMATKLVSRLIHNSSHEQQYPKFNWATRKALLITHGNELSTRRLIIFNKKTSCNCEAEIGDRKMFYSFKIFNYTNDSVDFYGMACTISQSTNDSAKYIRIRYIDDSILNCTIPPKQSVSFMGSLSFSTSRYNYNIDYVPKDSEYARTLMMLPGDDRSFYWAFLHKNPTFENARTPTFRTKFENWNQNSVNDIIDIIYSLLPEDKKLFSYARGLGHSDADTESKISNSHIHFNNAFSKDGNIYCEGQSQPFNYLISVFESTNRQEANKRFLEVVGRLKKEFPKYKVEFPDIPTSVRYAAFVSQDRDVIRVQLNSYDNNLSFHVMLDVRGDYEDPSQFSP